MLTTQAIYHFIYYWSENQYLLYFRNLLLFPIYLCALIALFVACCTVAILNCIYHYFYYWSENQFILLLVRETLYYCDIIL